MASRHRRGVPASRFLCLAAAELRGYAAFLEQAAIRRLFSAGIFCFSIAQNDKIMMTELSHFDAEGRAVMVDISGKETTQRSATAKALILMQPRTKTLIKEGELKKGDVFGVARLAGIMAAKRTADLIPLCHPLMLTAVTVEFLCEDAVPGIQVTATCRLTGRTGVEMEALTAAAVAALTVYDMCKAVDRGIRITDLRVVHKSGGKSGSFDGA